MTGCTSRIVWHRPVVHVQPEERRERYEARLALEWCRANGDPHLTAASTGA